MGENTSAVNPRLEWALRYIRLKWAVMPLRGKIPLTENGLKDATLNENQARAWWAKWPDANIGIVTGHWFWVLDVDVKSGGEDSYRYLLNQHGALPETLEQETGGGGRHILFAMPDFPVRNSASVIAPGIDVRGVGGYIVVPPSIHPETRRAYDWDGLKEIEEQIIAPAPAWLLEKLRTGAASKFPAAQPIAERIIEGGRNTAMFKAAASLRGKGFSEEEILATLRVSNQTRCNPPLADEELKTIAHSAARFTPNARGKVFVPEAGEVPPPAESDGADKNFPIGLADVEAAADAAIERKSPTEVMRLVPEIAKLRVQHQAVIVAKFREGFGAEWRSIEKWFDKALREASAERRGSAAPPDTPPPDATSGGEGGYPNLLGYPLTDAGNGERLVALYGRDIRYCLEFKKWLVWDGKRWMPDEASLMMRYKGKEMARVLHLQAIGRSTIEKHARDSESYSAISSALGCAAAEKGIAISAAELDQHPFLLNCPNGVLDLSRAKDGRARLLEHNREFLITKLCPIEYRVDADCPIFKTFVEWAMGAKSDSDAYELSEHTVRLVGFLQRILGSALTGDVSDKAFFVFHGSKGNNGKTTLLTLMRRILGSDYSCKIIVETILASSKGADATARADLADMRGMRLVVTSEISKETRIDEALIKRIVAGLDTIKACRKYENPVEFTANHKLIMDANYRPKVRGTDDAIWDRLKLVPWDVVRLKEERDKQLPDKLFAEAEGILAWCVRGCMAWRQDGLGEPPEVTGAGETWRESDDPLKEFLEDCCATDGGFVVASDLAAAYEWWCKQNRERYPIGREAFAERLESKGFTRNRSRRVGPDEKQARTWEGLELKSELVTTIRRAGMRGGSASEPGPWEGKPLVDVGND